MVVVFMSHYGTGHTMVVVFMSHYGTGHTMVVVFMSHYGTGHTMVVVLWSHYGTGHTMVMALLLHFAGIRECTICGSLATNECKNCYQQSGDGIDKIAFCDICLGKVDFCFHSLIVVKQFYC